MHKDNIAWKCWGELNREHASKSLITDIVNVSDTWIWNHLTIDTQGYFDIEIHEGIKINASLNLNLKLNFKILKLKVPAIVS